MTKEKIKEIRIIMITVAICALLIIGLKLILLQINKNSYSPNGEVAWKVDFIDEDGDYVVQVYNKDVNENCYFSVYDDKNQLVFSTGIYSSLSKDSDYFHLEKDKNYTIKTNSDNIYQIIIYNKDNEADTLHIWTPDKVYSKDNIDSNSFENYAKKFKNTTDDSNLKITENGIYFKDTNPPSDEALPKVDEEGREAIKDENSDKDVVGENIDDNTKEILN